MTAVNPTPLAVNQENAAPAASPLTLNDAVRRYLEFYHALNVKSGRTLCRERASLAKLCAHLGQLPVQQLTLTHLRDYALARQRERVSARTVNLDILALHHVLKFLFRMGQISAVVTRDWTPLRWVPPRRALLPQAVLRRFLAEARRRSETGRPVYPAGDLVADFVAFCAYTGSRREAALLLRWEDIDWERRQVHLRRGTKYDKSIVVDLCPAAVDLLRDMHARRGVHSPWVFPSPRDPGRPVRNLGRIRDAICDGAGIPRFNFHALRHYFISHAVMAGVDYLTIANWVGHADGGILIGRVYGHLSAAHRQAMAARLQL